ncbi:glycosyltransferase family A protein [Thermosynechococcaceae cyanobacterium BACA0444]|uniref:Glycosyltransferase family A protein n=1 Tax=Pseudocalidococcus azoricus BACA0444 TaxID=2918990 RepID=A0AAE4JWS1_9CYAN|nr:glycosyltransferase family A protein [Pseudocalidococcus azoricus]MDS3859214.1 glycosyltransferase family A protein [Pseudocalidococcus azoricus BACA0444]
MPLVSVIIPAFNAAHYLEQTLTSVIQQSLTDFEVLIIDDGSTDHTGEMVQAWVEQDQRIHYFYQANQGVSASRNYGIAQARGEFIAFLDADDLWYPDKLALQVKHLQSNPNLGVSFGRVNFLTKEGQPLGQLSTSPLVNLRPRDFLLGNPTTTSSNLLVRRATLTEIGGFDLEMRYAEDLEWLLRISCSQIWQIEGINQVLISYRTASGGLSSDLYQMEADWEIFLEKASIYAPGLIQADGSLARATHLRYLARRSLRLGLPPTVGLDFIWRAIRTDPRLWRQEPKQTLLTLIALYKKKWLF